MRIVAIIIGLLLAAEMSLGAKFHVATNGNDANPGTEDKPFATLEKARDAVRQASDRAGSTVILHAGVYRLTQSLEFNDKDSGTEKAPVVWRAAWGQTVRIIGGAIVPASAVQPVTDRAVLGRVIDANVRPNLKQINLSDVGVKDCGQIGPHGFRRPYIAAPAELFINGKVGKLVQWPKPGQPLSPVGKVLDKGPLTRYGEAPTRGGKFVVKTDRPKQWTESDDIWIYGLFENGYADSTVKIASIQEEKEGLVFTTVQPHMYGFTSGRPWNAWFAMNMLEEISLPGEFALDRKTNRLYFLPPEGIDARRAEFIVSEMEKPMLVFENASHIRIENVTIECSRGMGVYIEQGQCVRIVNCTLKNLGIVAVCIGQGASPDPLYRHAFTGTPVSRELGSWHEHIYENPAFDRNAGSGHGVIGCKIYDSGSGGVSLGGGNRVTLTAAGNFVENCQIHDFNRWDKTYRSAVNIDGVGNRVSHCEIYNAPAAAIYLHGNEHVIEYNDIHDAMTKGNDMGAFYMGRDPSERGNVIRYNYWHNLATAGGTHALYFDDAGGDGTKIYGNVFHKTGTSSVIFINGGSDFTIENNIFTDTATIVRQGGKNGNMGWLTKEGRFEARLKAVHYDQSPWKERYPEFQDYLKARKTMPRRDVFQNNLIVSSKPATGSCLTVKNNWTTTGDPGFVDMKKGNYELRQGAEAFKKIPGFKPGNFTQMGIEKKG